MGSVGADHQLGGMYSQLYHNYAHTITNMQCDMCVHVHCAINAVGPKE